MKTDLINKLSMDASNAVGEAYQLLSVLSETKLSDEQMEVVYAMSSKLVMASSLTQQVYLGTQKAKGAVKGAKPKKKAAAKKKSNSASKDKK